jgi:hypothetical protein
VAPCPLTVGGAGSTECLNLRAVTRFQWPRVASYGTSTVRHALRANQDCWSRNVPCPDGRLAYAGDERLDGGFSAAFGNRSLLPLWGNLRRDKTQSLLA